MLQANDVKTGGDLAQWRKERGWTQSRLAHMLLSSQKSISNIENRPFEPLKPKLLHALVMTENPGEARMMAQWITLFGQVLTHMQQHAMIPNLTNTVATTVATRLARNLPDELGREGVRVQFE